MNIEVNKNFSHFGKNFLTRYKATDRVISQNIGDRNAARAVLVIRQLYSKEETKTK